MWESLTLVLASLGFAVATASSGVRTPKKKDRAAVKAKKVKTKVDEAVEDREKAVAYQDSIRLEI